MYLYRTKANPYGTNILAETETKTIFVSVSAEIGPLRYENLDENRKKFSSDAWNLTIPTEIQKISVGLFCPTRIYLNKRNSAFCALTTWISFYLLVSRCLSISCLNSSPITHHTSPRTIWKALIDMSNINTSLPFMLSIRTQRCEWC
jgi:hypothetical protein